MERSINEYTPSVSAFVLIRLAAPFSRENGGRFCLLMSGQTRMIGLSTSSFMWGSA